ncbi:MAG: zeta toxin family protein [Candidatus Binatia bacterium]
MDQSQFEIQNPGRRPHLVVLAGPNGAGKSTAAPTVLRGQLGVLEFVNADTIARGLSAFSPERAAIDAGRIMLSRLEQLAVQRHSFAFETTLASRTFAPRIQRWMRSGYAFHLIFLWLPSADFARARVLERVRLGGHDVPEVIITRRYHRGVTNFFTLYQPLATTWRFYDNSGRRPRLLARGEGTERITVTNPQLWSRIVEEHNARRAS